MVGRAAGFVGFQGRPLIRGNGTIQVTEIFVGMVTVDVPKLVMLHAPDMFVEDKDEGTQNPVDRKCSNHQDGDPGLVNSLFHGQASPGSSRLMVVNPWCSTRIEVVKAVGVADFK